MSKRRRHSRSREFPGVVVLIHGKWCRIHTPPYGIERVND